MYLLVAFVVLQYFGHNGGKLTASFLSIGLLRIEKESQ